jgi:predicted nucleic acid-binding protein
MIYADTSVLASLHMLDVNTSRAVALVRSLTEPLVYSALIRLELLNALSLAVFRGDQTQGQAEAARQNIEADVRARLLVPTSIHWQAAFRRAAVIARNETPTIGGRSFDILHIASAEQLQIAEFVTFDHRQKNLAAQLGFRVRT